MQILNKIPTSKIEFRLWITEKQLPIVILFKPHDKTWWQEEIVLIIHSVIQVDVLQELVEVELLLRHVTTHEIVMLIWLALQMWQLLLKALVSHYLVQVTSVWVILSVHSIWFAGQTQVRLLTPFLSLFLRLLLLEFVCREVISMIHKLLDGLNSIVMIQTTLLQTGKYAKVDLHTLIL